MSQATPEPGKLRKGEGSPQFKTPRLMFRIGSGEILQDDITKPAPITYKLEQEPPSPKPSADRHSAIFVTEECSSSSDNSAKMNIPVPGTPPISCIEKVRLPINGEEDCSDDYLAFVAATMQRRASRKTNRLRISSFILDQEVQQRSFCFTTSPRDTTISIEERPSQEVTQKQIFENIPLHKKVLSNMKMQPWDMRRKLKLVQQGKSYIKRNQISFAHLRSLRDILAWWNIQLVQILQHIRRYLTNISNSLIRWESRIIEIESQFGSDVAYYFTFLRWLIWVNMIISVALVTFAVMPELSIFRPKFGERRFLTNEITPESNFYNVWEFQGVMKYSSLFYAHETGGTDRVALVYFMTEVGVCVYSLVAILRKMIENLRKSKLSAEGNEYKFSCKLFTGWDYMVRNTETAQNRVVSTIIGFKEALQEETQEERKLRNWKITALRVMVNLVLIALLTVSSYAVAEVMQRSTKEAAITGSFWRRNETTIVTSLIMFLFPIIFEVLGYFEHYHPRKQLCLLLIRIMVLNILNLYSLIVSLLDIIHDMTNTVYRILENELIYFVDTAIDSNKYCHKKLVNCSQVNVSTASIILSNLTLAFLNQTQHIPNIFYGSPSTASYLENITKDSVINFTLPLNVEVITENINETKYYYEEDYKYFNYNALESFKNKSTKETLNEFELTTKFYNYSNEIEYDQDNDDNFNFDYSTLNKSEYKITTTDSSTSDYYMRNNETSIEYLENQNKTSEYYKNNEKNFNFDYSKVQLSNTSSTKNLILQILISTLLNTSKAENSNETVTLIWNTEKLLSSIYSTINKLNFNASKNIKDFTIEENKNGIYNEFSTNITKTDITETVTDFYKKITKESYALCEVKDCYLKNDIKDDIMRKYLRRLCWETMFGQELVKIIVTDLLITIISTLVVDFIRAIFVRVMSKYWCWDLERKFPGYGEFKIGENIIHLVNNQGIVWMGMFFCPGIVFINLIKLTVMMYLRSWAVLTCNIPHDVVIKPSKSNNFYLFLLLTMLFLCVLPVGYSIVRIKPSWHCGPFSKYTDMYHVFTGNLPRTFKFIFEYIASPFIIIPLFVFLVIIIYYMNFMNNALRETNNYLKLQFRKDRKEKFIKMIQIADRKRRIFSGDSGDVDGISFDQRKKVLPMLLNSKSFDADFSGKKNEAADNKNYNDILMTPIHKAIKKSPEPNSPYVSWIDIDGTDTE